MMFFSEQWLYWLPGPCSIMTSFPTYSVKAVTQLTCSFISNQYLVCGLLIALMMEALQNSEMLLNLYQPTCCYNPEHRHLHTHHREILKSDSAYYQM
jgi:hypothetical protein